MSVAVPSPDEERTASGLAVFRHRDFALFSGVRVAAGLAQQMQTDAGGWVLYDSPHSALALGLVGLTGALQRRVHRGDALLGVNKGVRCLLRIALGVGVQALGQGLQPGFSGDLGLGAPLGLVGQIEVLKARLGVGRKDLAPERIVELALALDAREDGRAPLLQLAKIAQALIERAQLRVVEGASGLLAVSCNEGHRGAAVQQVDGSLDLPLLCIQLARNLL